MATPVGPSIGASEVPPHRAFFEALGALPEGSADWRAALAGLVTLRYLDAWGDTHATAADLGSERRAVDNAIGLLPNNVPERMFLAGLIEAATSEGATDLTRVVSLLLAYGRALQQRSAWAMAADVLVGAYRACEHAAQQPVQRELATAAVLRAGACYRELGDPAAADRAYQVALTLGRDAGDEYIVLRARTAIARLAADRGDAFGEEREQAIIGHIASDRPANVRRGTEPTIPTARASGDVGVQGNSESPSHSG